jgi:enamine deaminase RidA (YjgF/YER057c/UK114 family)
LTDALTILDKKFQDIVQTLLDPVFTQAEADVFLESLNKRAQELVGNLSQITAAQGLLEMQDQLSGVLGILREMVAGGASVDQLNEFVAGAMSGLQTLGATLGVSVDDFAQIAAALTAAGQEATNVAEFNRYVAEQGLTPAEAAALDAFFASQAPAATSIGAGSLTATGGGQVVTNVTVNLPPGVSGQDVIDALYDYATTQGATVPAPFQFVNVG